MAFIIVMLIIWICCGGIKSSGIFEKKLSADECHRRLKEDFRKKGYDYDEIYGYNDKKK